MPGMMPGAPGWEGPPDDPEMRELVNRDADFEKQSFELAERIHRAPGEEREKLKSQLGELVNKHFDVRQQRRELQLKRMEDELKRLREAIAKRNESRQSIVKNRIGELVGDPQDRDF
jgi:hypothetical protein